MFVNYFCVWNNIILCYERENITVRYFCGYQHSIVSENGGLIMLLTLIGIILCALGFAGLIFSADRYFDSGIEILSGFALGIGIIWLMVCIMFIIITHCTIRNNISNDQYEREKQLRNRLNICQAITKMYQRLLLYKKHMIGIKKFTMRNIGLIIYGQIGFGLKSM